MNYFTALLLAAGLPVTAVPAASVPTPATATTQAVAVTTLPVASVEDAYATMLAQSLGAATATPANSPNTATAASPTSSAASSAVMPAGSDGQTMAQLAEEMIQLINTARIQNGLAPYAVNNTLMTLAQERAQALANGPFTSDLPQYGWPIQMELAAGINAEGMGAENIAEAESVQQAFQLLMADPTHRANILNPYETQIGVGVAPWGTGVAISELFIGPNL
ncbi:MAG: CAP domain-containing protein [Firmicutes bacterium]|nr:CAP domain-containing protein [Bacillota bacterium]